MQTILANQIERLNASLIKWGVDYSVYNYNAYTINELIMQFYKHLNECIDNVNEYTKMVVCLMNWIKEEGLQQSVNKALDEMVENGTLDKIINQKIFEELNDKIDSNIDDLAFLEEEFKSFKENLNGTIDDLKRDITDLIEKFKKEIAEEYSGVKEQLNTLNEFDIRNIVPVTYGYIMMKKSRVGQGLGVNNCTGEIFGSRVNSDEAGKAQSYMISKFSPSGAEISSMVAENGGHGTSFGVEPVWNQNTRTWDTYIWSNWDVVNTNGETVGHKVVRYRYDDNKPNIVISDPTVEIINTGSEDYTIPVIDTVCDLICLVRKQNERYRIEVMSLSKLKKGDKTILGNLDLGEANDFLQGVAISDNLVFWRIGTSDGSLPDKTYVFDWKLNKLLYVVNTGMLRPLTSSDDEMENFREPEGICVYTNPLTKRRSLFLMTIIGEGGRRKHLIHAYHQVGNGSNFIPDGMGQKIAITKPDGQLLDIPKKYTSLSQVTQVGQYYMENWQYNTFNDVPLPGCGEGWFLTVGGHKNSWTTDCIQTMVRNSYSETDVYIRLVRNGQVTPWVPLHSNDGIREINTNRLGELTIADEYYLNTAQFEKMVDKPKGATSGGYFLHNSAKDTNESFVQTLTKNSVTDPMRFYRLVRKDQAHSGWYRINATKE